MARAASAITGLGARIGDGVGETAGAGAGGVTGTAVGAAAGVGATVGATVGARTGAVGATVGARTGAVGAVEGAGTGAVTGARTGAANGLGERLGPETDGAGLMVLVDCAIAAKSLAVLVRGIPPPTKRKVLAERGTLITTGVRTPSCRTGLAWVGVAAVDWRLSA
jgi:hypothetical protein